MTKNNLFSLLLTQSPLDNLNESPGNGHMESFLLGDMFEGLLHPGIKAIFGQLMVNASGFFLKGVENLKNPKNFLGAAIDFLSGHGGAFG